jgi:hypothetical protein
MSISRMNRDDVRRLTCSAALRIAANMCQAAVLSKEGVR